MRGPLGERRGLLLAGRANLGIGQCEGDVLAGVVAAADGHDDVLLAVAPSRSSANRSAPRAGRRRRARAPSSCHRREASRRADVPGGEVTCRIAGDDESLGHERYRRCRSGRSSECSCP